MTDNHCQLSSNTTTPRKQSQIQP